MIENGWGDISLVDVEGDFRDAADAVVRERVLYKSGKEVETETPFSSLSEALAYASKLCRDDSSEEIEILAAPTTPQPDQAPIAILIAPPKARVGDVVTVENTTGTVSRIRIRATTIVNWERQELVIPNKSFITGQLINWTLSDTVNRVMINVGVSYDTDTRQAMELMSQVAEEHPKVITDPPPRITFEGFGDNALTLFMRAYLNDVDSRLQTITELHQAILDRFRAAGIEIAFPQRDVHFDTDSPLKIQVVSEGSDIKPDESEPKPDG